MVTRRFVCALLLSLLPLPAVAGMCALGSFTGKVTYVRTAKKIELEGFFPLLLSGVAVPEWDEEGGQSAKDAMRAMLLGTTVRCVMNGDGYDRCVATCYLDGADIAEMIIAMGLARDCPRYSGGRYQEAEHRAAQQGATISEIYKLPEYCERATAARQASSPE
jgi:endonuclease YncB( thermonuclease family)